MHQTSISYLNVSSFFVVNIISNFCNHFWLTSTILLSFTSQMSKIIAWRQNFKRQWIRLVFWHSTYQIHLLRFTYAFNLKSQRVINTKERYLCCVIIYSWLFLFNIKKLCSQINFISYVLIIINPKASEGRTLNE